ncbi:hypothetical protein B484DRAFT_396244 [Ochromonadaceae sp. CCMP2298]|nr:hypothetical protein B484DRAFT_396244 [Ochromonadaceae sp. CCMP2298]
MQAAVRTDVTAVVAAVDAVHTDFSVPTLLLPGGRTSLFDLVKGMFVTKMQLSFLCPVTLRRVDFYVLTALCSVLGTGVGAVIVVASTEALRALSSQLSEQYTDVARHGTVEGESLSTEYVVLLWDLGNAAAGQRHGQGQQQSYRATYDLLRLTPEKDTGGTSEGSWKPRLTGLHFVISERDRTSAWVSSAAMDTFNTVGADALIL